MLEWFNHMSTYQQVFWGIGLAFGLVFLLQMVLSFAGIHDGGDISDAGAFDHGGDIGHGHDHWLGDAGGWLTIRNLINFMLGFGWGGVAAISIVGSNFIAVIIAIVIGMAFVYLFFHLSSALMQLNADKTMKIENAIGKTAQVYLTIPPGATGKGKVLVEIQQTTHELEAITHESAAIPTGGQVVIESIEDRLLVVKRVIQ
jgi:hypothetical protein